MRRRYVNYKALEGCLLGAEAEACLMNLIIGESGSRRYASPKNRRDEFGYYYEPKLGEWIIFDNRAGSCLVDTFKHEIDAQEALIDGAELLDF